VSEQCGATTKQGTACRLPAGWGTDHLGEGPCRHHADQTESHEISHPKKRAFLAAFAQTGNVTHSAEMADIDRRTHYDWLASDPTYERAFLDAREQAADRLEEEARRRAVQGTLRPVFYKGEEVGGIREYSDTLLIFLLKGVRPEKYAEHMKQDIRQQVRMDARVEHSGRRTLRELMADDESA